ncbi:MAG: MFS transporter [Xanthobacteraceae bacterium]|jgi:MFS family permease
MKRATLAQRLTDGVTMFVVTGLSLLLLVYVGMGEGKRIYEQFQIEKLVTHNRIIQTAMENYLRAGLPLKQYAGFSTLADPIVQSIDEIDAMSVFDQAGNQLFIVTDKDKKVLRLPSAAEAARQIKHDVEVERHDTFYQVAMPLRTRFEIVGSLVITAGTDVAERRVNASFTPLVMSAAGLAALFAMFVVVSAPYLARSRTPWLQIGYAVTFLTMAGFVVATLINLYSDGVQGKAKESAFTLSQRLSDIVEFNLRIRDFDGLDKVFAEYRRLNPEISDAVLILDGAIQVATDAAKIGKKWVSDTRSYEYTVDLSRPGQPNRSLIVAVPADVVYKRVERSVRNFAALFIASGFLAGLFLQVASSMQRLRTANPPSYISPKASVSEETALIVVKPIFFLAVFLEHLTYSFLPKFMQDAAIASGLSAGFAAAPFTAYYLSFALSLIPAGHFADRFGAKPMIWPGLILASASILGLTLPLGILPLAALRALSGIGQGMLFIGVQAYILAVASPEKKTQGNAIIVFGFQGGMISGMAIGSLLVNYLNPQGVFVTCAAIGFATALYSILLIPKDVRHKQAKSALGAAIRRVGSDLAKVSRSGEFLKTMFCIGVPAKAILTGAITFALPLLLGQYGYRQEEIGQIIMLYGIGVVVASAYVARMVDRTGNTETVLFWGAAISGLGLIFIGLMGSDALVQGGFGTFVVTGGVVTVGVAHGLINAPVVTHVAHSRLAAQIGANSVTTTYRFLERLGHVAGPFLVGQFFLIWGQNARVLMWIGVATAILGILFLIRTAPPRLDAIDPEPAR